MQFVKDHTQKWSVNKKQAQNMSIVMTMLKGKNLNGVKTRKTLRQRHYAYSLPSCVENHGPSGIHERTGDTTNARNKQRTKRF